MAVVELLDPTRVNLRADAARAYARYRARIDMPADALAAVIDALDDLSPEDGATWAELDDWEGMYQSGFSRPASGRPLLLARDDDLTDDLADVIRRMRVVYEDADQAYKGGSGGSYSVLASATKLYLDARRQYAEERRTKERLDQDVKDASGWQAEVVAMEEKLVAEYGAHGVQYEILCIMLAPLVVKLRKSYSGRIRLSTDEQTNLSRTATGLVAQLQKHTESTKTETHAVIKQVAVSVLAAIEPLLAAQPHLWARVVEEVDTRVRDGALALPEPD